MPNDKETRPEVETLRLVEALDQKVDKLQEGQANIQAMLAVHEERSISTNRRVGLIEKVGSSLFIGVALAVIGIAVSGCGLFSGLKPPPPETPAPEPPKIDVVKRGIENTVALHKVDGQRYCSGSAAESIIITAAHCVERAGFTVLYRGKHYPGVAVYIDQKTDLAFVDAIGARLRDSIPLAEKPPTWGSKVVWMGFPLAEDFIMGTGIVGNPLIDLGPATFMAIYGQFIPGNSGGPVFNYRGELIGVVSMTMAYGGNYLPVGYAVPFETIKIALDQHN